MRHRNDRNCTSILRVATDFISSVCPAMIGMGGTVLVSSGRSDDGTSGAASVETSPSGPNGVSGAVRIASGESTAGDSGALFAGTGDSKFGAGGEVRIRVGDAGFNDGGDAILQAGQASAQGAKGGRVVLSGGEGSSAHSTDGGERPCALRSRSLYTQRGCPGLTHHFSRRRRRGSHDQRRPIERRQSNGPRRRREDIGRNERGGPWRLARVHIRLLDREYVGQCL